MYVGQDLLSSEIPSSMCLYLWNSLLNMSLKKKCAVYYGPHQKSITHFLSPPPLRQKSLKILNYIFVEWILCQISPLKIPPAGIHISEANSKQLCKVKLFSCVYKLPLLYKSPQKLTFLPILPLVPEPWNHFMIMHFHFKEKGPFSLSLI